MRESAAEDEFDSPEAQDLPEQCRWCSKDSTTSVLALEAKAAKRANLYAGQRNSSLQGDNDALCSHVQDLHTVHCQAEFLRNT
mmetsp:Transcript_63607/g.132435  ORF Transcript_63607/g.132435 Transcript_63607/m.132435 type:complete len:83 (-) Transcript_63607:19-267(-)